jgi:signal transduction histidine kinase
MKKIVFVLMVVMVGAIGMAHYVTPGHLILFHDSFRRLSYFPIVIGAILYGVRGGLFMAVISCLSFIPHLFTFWYQGPEAYYSEFSEMFFYLMAGLVIGMISSRENRLREKYRALSEQLATSYKRLHEQAGQLVEAEAELGQARKLSLLGHLSASLAHEIKNPLASIKGAAEILADEVDREHPKHEFVDIMTSEISRLNNSVEEVLAYCRGQQTKADDRGTSMGQVLDQTLQVLAPQLREKSVDIEVRADEAARAYEVPAAPLTQVLMNLLLNGVEAVPPRGKIKISLTRQAAGLDIQVDDSGPGVSETDYDEVFRSFVTFKEGGTGLGLSISQKILQRLGGLISVDRSPDLGGARFHVRLPEPEKN